MKLLQNKPTAETAYYTGGDGTYISAVPTHNTSTYFKACCDTARSLGFDEATGPLDMHVTIIHSKNGIDGDQQSILWESGRAAPDRVLRATVVGFTHWAGHDGTGYVVMELHSDDLSELNYWLRNNFDLPVSFEDYRAHVTIVTNAYKKDGEAGAEQLIRVLNKLPAPQSLAFCGIRVEDLA